MGWLGLKLGKVRRKYSQREALAEDNSEKKMNTYFKVSG